jgi:polyisoprenoid-binding protein YceI
MRAYRYIIVFIFSIAAILTIKNGLSITGKQEPLHLEDITGRWEIVNEESEFLFEIGTMIFFTVDGSMNNVTGSLDYDQYNTKDFVSLKIKVESLETGNDKRDKDLKSEDFFNAVQFPDITFKGGEINQVDSENGLYKVKGMLTIKGITLTEEIPITFEGYSNSGNDKIKFSGSTTIDRKKYNIVHTSGKAIGNTATVTYHITAKKN